MNNDSFKYLLDENRIGKFYIHTSHLFKASTLQALRDCFIVKAERGFRSGDTVEYDAFSQNFGQCPVGCETPQYYLALDASGKIHFLKRVPEHGIPDDWTALWCIDWRRR